MLRVDDDDDDDDDLVTQILEKGAIADNYNAKLKEIDESLFEISKILGNELFILYE